MRIMIFNKPSLTRHRTAGFSLIEILGGLALTLILLGLVGVSLRGSIEREGPRGLAHTLVSDLRAARGEAQRSGKMVAICFPSDGKTNSISQSAALRKGEQRGQLWKVLSYDQEFDAKVFLGTWPGSAVLGDSNTPLSWVTSTNDEIAIIFRSDGSAFSNDLPSIDGNLPIVVGSGFRGNFNGPTGTLSHASNPTTVWVSAAGTIDVEENKLPVGTLPSGESEPPVAQLDLSSEPAPGTPTLIDARFFPEQVPGLPTAFIGQNFVNIHPEQKDEKRLEYGLATIEIDVRDTDGGPLNYVLETTTTGALGGGRYTVTNEEGQLRYHPEEDLWKAVISWRPPPQEVDDVAYELTVNVTDPDGNVLEVSTAASILPTVTTLPPARLVVCTDDGAGTDFSRDLYITNLDGSNEVHVTKDGNEIQPFFSNDGSHLFSFHEPPNDNTVRVLRGRPADGSTAYRTLATIDIPSGDEEVRIDPQGRFAAIMANPFDVFFPFGYIVMVNTGGGGTNDPNTSGGNTSTPELRTGTSKRSVQNLRVISLMDGTEVFTFPQIIAGSFDWADGANFAFRYRTAEPTDLVDLGRGFGVHHAKPGISGEPTTHLAISGYPPSAGPTGAFSTTARDRIYNRATPRWYLQLTGTGASKTLTVVGPSTTQTVATGNIEYDTNLGKTPTWSANGENIAFVTSSGGSSKVTTMKVLNSAFGWDGANVTFEREAPGQSMAAVDPDGEHVYFLQGGKLYRAENKTGSTAVPISDTIGKPVAGYAVSP